MLQCEWPTVWSVESREAIRVALETAIRKAMAGSTNSQIRGLVNVDLPNLGASPPELVLSGIRELSVERTAVMVKLRYNGDFSVTLRGLQINLDTIGSSGGEADANLALPFYCPFEMTLHDIFVDGLASIELLQELEESVGTDGSEADGATGTRGASSAVERSQPSPHFASSPSASSAQPQQSGRLHAGPSRAPSAGFSSGFGVLLGAGGRRAMRPPEAFMDDAAAGLRANRLAPSGPRGSAAVTAGGGAEGNRAGMGPNGLADGGGRASPGSRDGSVEGIGSDGARAQGSAERHSVFDLVSKKVSVRRRTVKIQLFGDPIKNWSVASNFASVPGANSKVEGTIKMLIKPSIERMMTEGITIHF